MGCEFISDSMAIIPLVPRCDTYIVPSILIDDNFLDECLSAMHDVNPWHVDLVNYLASFTLLVHLMKYQLDKFKKEAIYYI